METPVEQQAPWHPDLSPKQARIFNTGLLDAKEQHPDVATSLLVSGSRMTGKSIGVEHRIVRHLWETPGARVALISKTIRNMTDGGVWSDLMEIILPQWFAGVGMQFTTKDRYNMPGPKTDAKTRTIYFRVSNMYGGESELRLLSIEHDHQVSEKVKGTRYSAMWFSELSHFIDAKVFEVSSQQLRMYHLKPWQHLWVADTNPPEEGEAHWAYKYWFLRKVPDVKDDIAGYARSFKLIEVFLEDSPFLTPGQISAQKQRYADDPGEYAREIEGKWVSGHGTRGKHFSDLFIYSTHVVGGGEGEGDQIDVAPDSTILYTGWDLGSVNHAAVILEKRITNINGQEWSVWNALDCLLYLGEQMTLTEFTLEFLKKIDSIERLVGRAFQWVHWSDDTAINVWRPTSSSYDYLEVQAACRNVVGRHWDKENELWTPAEQGGGARIITLQGAEKPEGSVKGRVRLLRRLLKEERFFISSRCQPIIDMLGGCCSGNTKTSYVADNQFKHIFDALTYPIFMESNYEMEMLSRRPEASSQVVDSVSL